MKLNNDCIRDVLMFIEKEQKLEENYDSFELTIITPQMLFDGLPKHSKEEIIYSVMMLDQAEIIEAEFICGNNDMGDFYINSLTYEGHEFIEKIKNENVWGKTKAVAKTVGSGSINVIAQIATQVLTTLINQQMGSIF